MIIVVALLGLAMTAFNLTSFWKTNKFMFIAWAVTDLFLSGLLLNLAIESGQL